MANSIRARDLIRILVRQGFNLDRVRGSHHIFSKTGHARAVSVPVHGNADLPAGTLSSILKQAGFSRDQLQRLRDDPTGRE